MMRPSERLFEANFYSQVARAWYPAQLMWFTPSTVDEADLGFDAMVNLNARFFFFQFKHPQHHRIRRRPCGQAGHDYFQGFAKHDQLMVLRGHAGNWPVGSFFYAMPALLTWADYAAAGVPNLLAHTYYMDVLDVPPNLAAPTTSAGTPRVTGEHQLNLDPYCPRMQLRSDPVDLPCSTIAELVLNTQAISGGEEYRSELPQDVVGSAASFRGFLADLPPTTMGLAVVPQ